MGRPFHPHRVIWLGMAVLVVCSGARAAVRFDQPQAKINWIDASEAPRIRVYFSVLDRLLRPLPPRLASEIEILRHNTPDSHRGEPVVRFEDMVAQGAEGAEVQPLAKREEGRDIVLVVPGHQGPELRDGLLGPQQRAAVSLLLKRLGPDDRVNVVWYSDRLQTYVAREGKRGELSDLADSRARCDEELREQYTTWGEEPTDTAPPSCGLTAEPDLLAEVLARVPFRGYYPRLLGVDGPGLCIAPRHPPLAHGRDGEPAIATGGAIDEAFRLLLRYGRADRPRLMFLLSDGKDGYLEADEDCRLHFEAEVEAQLRAIQQECRRAPGGYRACLAARDLNGTRRRLLGIHEKKLDERITLAQQRFRDERLVAWLALARAAGVRVFAVAYPTARPHERERLEVLAYRTGGTFRQADEASELPGLVGQLLDEIGGQYVADVDAGLAEGATAAYSVRVQVPGAGRIATAAVGVTGGVRPHAMLVFAKQKLRWLERLVGAPWHIVILVVGGLLALFVLYGLVRGIGGLLKMLFGSGRKKARALAKGARPPVPKPFGR